MAEDNERYWHSYDNNQPSAGTKYPFPKGCLLVATSEGGFSPLTAVEDGNVLISSGVGNCPVWGKIDPSKHVTGALLNNASDTSNTDLEKTVADSKTLLDETIVKVDNNKTLLDETIVKVDNNKTLLDETVVKVDNNKTLLDETKILVDDTKALLNITKSQLETSISGIEIKVADSKTQLDESVISLETKLSEAKSSLGASVINLQNSIADNKTNIDLSINNLQNSVADHKTLLDQTTISVTENKSAVDLSINSLQNLVSENKTTMDSAITNLQNSITENKTLLDQTAISVTENKLAVDLSINSLQNSITENKTLLDQTVDDLKNKSDTIATMYSYIDKIDNKITATDGVLSATFGSANVATLSTDNASLTNANISNLNVNNLNASNLTLSSDVSLSAGKTLCLRSGQVCGKVQLTDGVAIVANTIIGDADIVLLNRVGTSGALPTSPPLVTIEEGVSFTITSQIVSNGIPITNANDYSTYTWMIIKSV